MAWRSTGSTNAQLIANLARFDLITSSRVQTAMTGVDRAHYCPSPQHAYEDSPQSIGYGATISAPHMHASAAESLLPFIHERARILDVGSGSGYLVHVFANLIGDGGKVVGIDHIPQLVEMSKTNMRKSQQGAQFLDSGQVELVCGDGRKGYAPGGPYDAIHVGAAAVEVHKDLIDQLNKPGRLFIPVEDGDGGHSLFGGNQWIWVIDKDKDGMVTRKRDMGVRYVPLTDAPKS